MFSFLDKTCRFFFDDLVVLQLSHGFRVDTEEFDEAKW